MPDVLRVTRTCTIPLDELEWRFTASGGPGGQHANRSNTRAELRFDIESSPSLGPRQRERLISRLGPTVRIVVDEHRSQARNRSEALDRLAARLAHGLHIERKRVETKPSKGAKERRLEAKRRQATRKRERRWSAGDEQG